MSPVFETTLKISILLFTVGNTAHIGLETELREAAAALRDVRFVALTIGWAFVFCPAFAWLLTQVLPMDPAYETGLLLIAMVPCAPFLPVVVRRARGDLAYAAALMLLTAAGTVAFMPVAVPLMVKGLSAGFWTIAKPLVLLVLVPLAIGTAVRQTASGAAARLRPFVRRTVAVATVVALIDIVVVYGRQFLDAIGSFAMGSQILFTAVAALAAYAFGSALPQGRRSVLALGLVTRNLGAAFAPLIAIRCDPRTTVMIALALPVQFALAFLGARWLASRAAREEPPAPQDAVPGATPPERRT